MLQTALGARGQGLVSGKGWEQGNPRELLLRLRLGLLSCCALAWGSFPPSSFFPLYTLQHKKPFMVWVFFFLLIAIKSQ